MYAEADGPQPSLPVFQSYHPSTFLDRGVAVPFTTPALTGARARPASRGGLEILVPNPSGGRGIYILPWDGICRLCKPTIYDTVLHQRISCLRHVTPDTIMREARQLTAEGLAGRAASDTAQAAAEADRQERLVTNFMLLLLLIEQVEPAELADLATGHSEPESLSKRGRNAIERIAPRLNRSPETVTDSLEELAALFSGMGALREQRLPRLLRLLHALRGLRAEMAAWQEKQSDDSASAAAMIATVADTTIACAARTLSDAHALQRDMAKLLRRWFEQPAEVAAIVGRPAWLLDGWEQICLLWRSASSESARRAAIFELALLVPVLPKETSDWVGLPVDTDIVWRYRRTVRRLEDWRTGATLDLIAANERLRAMAI